MTEIHPTAIVHPSAKLGAGTTVGPYAIVEADVELGESNTLWAHSYVGRFTRMGDGNHVHPYATVGHLPQDVSFDPATETFTRIGDRNTFREHCSVHRATKPGEATTIGSDCLLMAHSHVGHDSHVGNHVILVNNSVVAGHCEIMDRAILSGYVAIHQFCRVGRFAMISGLSVANKDVPPFFLGGGRPALFEGINAVGLKRNGFEPAERKDIKQACRILFREGLTVPEACAKIEAECTSAGAQELVEFVRASKRGITISIGGGGDSLSTKPRRVAGAAQDDGAD